MSRIKTFVQHSCYPPRVQFFIMSKINSNNSNSLHKIVPVEYIVKIIDKIDIQNANEIDGHSKPTILLTNVLEFYKIFHNFCYFMFIMPFKITHEQPNGQIQFTGSQFKKVWK